MHGDEPTATSALLDVLEHLGRTRKTPDTERLLSRLTLAIIPMLNPDGAARTRRTNAQGIDVNRDALRLQTPEGRFLKSVRDRLKPSVGYNLHNHSPNVTAGKHGRQVAISLLSVPFDDAFTVNEGRRTTMRMAVLVQQLLEPWAKDRVARYDMDYTARAFGDSMTRWGTPTLLIESGGFFGPDEADMLVRLNFVALLGTLHALADGSLAKVDVKAYDAIPLNTRDRLFDVLVRNARVIGGGGLPPFLADVGLNVAPARPGFSGASSTRDARRRPGGGRPDGLPRQDRDRPRAAGFSSSPRRAARTAGKRRSPASRRAASRRRTASSRFPSPTFPRRRRRGSAGAAPLAPGYGGDFLVLEAGGRGSVPRRAPDFARRALTVQANAPTTSRT